MTKQIFTKTQAISILVQIQNKDTQKLVLLDGEELAREAAI